jgi:hypothetical protein
MSQRNVELVIGKLATDEALRRAFLADPGAALAQQVAEWDLNPCERQALAALDPEALERFAAALDPRIQKSDLHGGCR